MSASSPSTDGFLSTFGDFSFCSEYHVGVRRPNENGTSVNPTAPTMTSECLTPNESMRAFIAFDANIVDAVEMVDVIAVAAVLERHST